MNYYYCNVTKKSLTVTITTLYYANLINSRHLDTSLRTWGASWWRKTKIKRCAIYIRQCLYITLDKIRNGNTQSSK